MKTVYCALLALMFCACGSRQDDYHQPMEAYYVFTPVQTPPISKMDPIDFVDVPAQGDEGACARLWQKLLKEQKRSAALRLDENSYDGAEAAARDDFQAWSRTLDRLLYPHVSADRDLGKSGRFSGSLRKDEWRESPLWHSAPRTLYCLDWLAGAELQSFLVDHWVSLVEGGWQPSATQKIQLRDYAMLRVLRRWYGFAAEPARAPAWFQQTLEEAGEAFGIDWRGDGARAIPVADTWDYYGFQGLWTSVAPGKLALAQLYSMAVKRCRERSGNPDALCPEPYDAGLAEADIARGFSD